MNGLEKLHKMADYINNDSAGYHHIQFAGEFFQVCDSPDAQYSLHVHNNYDVSTNTVSIKFKAVCKCQGIEMGIEQLDALCRETVNVRNLVHLTDRLDIKCTAAELREYIAELKAASDISMQDIQ